MARVRGKEGKETEQEELGVVENEQRLQQQHHQKQQQKHLQPN